jgi:hypothetical protein
MGADHANLWRASTTTGPGTIQEYYDELGVMGIGSSDGLRHFSAFQKWAWWWMPDKNVAMVEKLGSGKYKLYAQDNRDAANTNNYLLAMVCIHPRLLWEEA